VQIRLNITSVALVLLIGIGFWGALSLSQANFTGQSSCPHLLGLAICYVVAVAYGLMLGSVFLKPAVIHSILFFSAWGITFLIALFGSGLELSQGGVCPITSIMLPLCYVSLAMCLAIMGLYLLIRMNKAGRTR
jgi:hypothetical protein